MKTLNDNLNETAAGLNLITAHITQGMNNYPVNTDDEIGVIGFDNFAEAEALKNSLINEGLEAEICLLKRRDGWYFWQNMGRKYEPLTVQDYDLAKEVMSYSEDVWTYSIAVVVNTEDMEDEV